LFVNFFGNAFRSRFCIALSEKDLHNNKIVVSHNKCDQIDLYKRGKKQLEKHAGNEFPCLCLPPHHWSANILTSTSHMVKKRLNKTAGIVEPA